MSSLDMKRVKWDRCDKSSIYENCRESRYLAGEGEDIYSRTPPHFRGLFIPW